MATPDTGYKNLRFTEQERAAAKFRDHLGGGTKHWDKRGKFQVHLLTLLGLLPRHRFLDIGCGPIRAGEHFIRYLDTGNYHGIDYNADFIEIAARIVADDPGLAAKKPSFQKIDNFDLEKISGPFDFALAFSVLNHSTEPLRKTFFEQLPSVLALGGVVCISHATWFNGALPSKRLIVSRSFRSAIDLDPSLDMRSWGWEEKDSAFPFLEIKRLPD